MWFFELPDVLTEKQKIRKIGNMLSTLKHPQEKTCIFHTKIMPATIILTLQRDRLFSKRQNILKINTSRYSSCVRLSNNQIDQVEGEEEDIAGYDANGV